MENENVVDSSDIDGSRRLRIGDAAVARLVGLETEMAQTLAQVRADFASELARLDEHSAMHIAHLNAEIARLQTSDRSRSELQMKLDAHASELARVAEEQQALRLTLAERDSALLAIQQSLAERDEAAEAKAIEHRAALAQRDRLIQEKDAAIADVAARLNANENSRSWRMTAPLRRRGNSIPGTTR
jgi:hypothetical protein